MLQIPQVKLNWLRHPFFWPRFFFLAIGVVYLSLNAFVFFQVSRESREQEESARLFKEALDARRREIINLKLSGMEPFVWRPALECRTLAEEQPQPSTPGKEGCIRTDLFFQADLASIPGDSYLPGNPSEIIYREKTPQNCLLCHRNQQQSVVSWQFHTAPKAPPAFFTNLAGSNGFYAANTAFLGFWLLFLFFRTTSFLRGNLNLVAISVLLPELSDREVRQWLKKIRLHNRFLYLETGQGYLRGYLPRGRFRHWIKKQFTSKSGFSEDALFIRAAAFEIKAPSLLKASSEGMRVAQAMASRPDASAFMVQNELLAGINVDSAKKAIWKTSRHSMEFRFLSLPQAKSEKNQS